MSQIICVHSYRGGTGKSTITANLAVQLAAMGNRVGVIDTDIQSPGIHVLFNLGEDEINFTLLDYLWGKCAIAKAAYDVTARLDAAIPGRISLVPSSIKAADIARILREGYDVGLLRAGYADLIRDLQLDVLMIDTHLGLNEETLLSIVIANTVILVLRPDQQDYQGTGVLVDVARKLGVKRMQLIVNKVPHSSHIAELRSLVGYTYQCEVSATLLHSDAMMKLGSAGIFSLRYPTSELSLRFQQMANRISESYFRISQHKAKAIPEK